MGSQPSQLMPASGVSMDRAREHLAQSLSDTQDRMNADTALDMLRAQHNQPMGYRPVTLQLRPAVLDYFRQHHIPVHHPVRVDDLIHCEVSV